MRKAKIEVIARSPDHGERVVSVSAPHLNKKPGDYYCRIAGLGRRLFKIYGMTARQATVLSVSFVRRVLRAQGFRVSRPQR